MVKLAALSFLEEDCKPPESAGDIYVTPESYSDLSIHPEIPLLHPQKRQKEREREGKSLFSLENFNYFSKRATEDDAHPLTFLHPPRIALKRAQMNAYN